MKVHSLLLKILSRQYTKFCILCFCYISGSNGKTQSVCWLAALNRLNRRSTSENLSRLFSFKQSCGTRSTRVDDSPLSIKPSVDLFKAFRNGMHAHRVSVTERERQSYWLWEKPLTPRTMISTTVHLFSAQKKNLCSLLILLQQQDEVLRDTTTKNGKCGNPKERTQIRWWSQT
jgi:hypothetical protein